MSEKHFCQVLCSGCCIVCQPAAFNYHCLLPSKPGSVHTGSKVRDQAKWGDVLGLRIIQVFLVDHLVVDNLFIKRLPLFQLLRGPPLLLICMYFWMFSIVFCCLLCTVLDLFALLTLDFMAALILPLHFLSLTQNNRIKNS